MVASLLNVKFVAVDSRQVEESFYLLRTSLTISLFPVRRVPPHFTIPPEPSYDVMVGSSLNVTCVAVGSPMPHVKWQKGAQDITGDIPLMGKNVLELHNIQDSANYTCVAASKLGIIETTTLVKVQGKIRTTRKIDVLVVVSGFYSLIEVIFTIHNRPNLPPLLRTCGST